MLSTLKLRNLRTCHPKVSNSITKEAKLMELEPVWNLSSWQLEHILLGCPMKYATVLRSHFNIVFLFIKQLPHSVFQIHCFFPSIMLFFLTQCNLQYLKPPAFVILQHISIFAIISHLIFFPQQQQIFVVQNLNCFLASMRFKCIH